MQKQGKVIDGKVVGGIEWTKTVLADGTEYCGYTHNPIAGCFHACQWEMPNGVIANCYAEDVAEKVAMQSYPEGFEHHYWRPDKVDEPKKKKKPLKIFLGSMADIFGHWVPKEQIEIVLDMIRETPWHTYQLLSKNIARAAEFDLPPNVWLGSSSPPDFMWNKRLTTHQKEKWLETAINNLGRTKATVRWMSFEPLSFDYSPIIAKYPGIFRWIVIGAASAGSTLFAPEEEHFKKLMDVLQKQGVKVFFKGNMKSLPAAAANWLEEFPEPYVINDDTVPLPVLTIGGEDYSDSVVQSKLEGFE